MFINALSLQPEWSSTLHAAVVVIGPIIGGDSCRLFPFVNGKYRTSVNTEIPVFLKTKNPGIWYPPTTGNYRYGLLISTENTASPSLVVKCIISVIKCKTLLNVLY